MEEPIQFGTDGWRATKDVFTEDRVRIVGNAIASHLSDVVDGNNEVIVGYDARENSSDFADLIGSILERRGFDVIIPDRDLPTPIIAFTVVHRKLDGAVMVTASHNPPEYNGIKFIPADGAPALPEVTDDIEGRLGVDFDEEGPRGSAKTLPADEILRPYRDHLESIIEPNSHPEVKVVYDAMHGSGRGVTDQLLERFGVDVHRIRCTRDTRFGGVSPEPVAENLGELLDSIAGGDRSLGLANDGDADRVAVVTPNRGVIGGGLLLAVCYEYLLQNDMAGTAIRSVSTSGMVDRIAADHGHDTVETPVGFKWVGKAMAEHDAVIGGEESGGFTIRGHIREKDGILSALLAIVAHADETIDRRIDRLFDTYGQLYQDKRSLECPEDAKRVAIDAISSKYPDTLAGCNVEAVREIDGFKFLLSDGTWILLRPSGTEPKFRIYAEARSAERVAELLDAGEALVDLAR